MRKPITHADILADVGHLMVKSVAAREGTPECEALFSMAVANAIAPGGELSTADLLEIADDLDHCRMRVRDWLFENSPQGNQHGI